MAKVTNKTIKALNIIKNFVDKYGRGITASEFAKEMWKNSKCWSRVYNQGHGATKGKGMWLSAGSYLAKLKYADFVYSDILGCTRIFYLTSLGESFAEIKEKGNK